MKKTLAILLSSTCLFSAQALAQSAPEGAAAGTPQPVGTQAPEGGDIVVTAQRREERLSDVPIAISVIGGDMAQAQGVVNSRDLGTVTPGLVSGQAGYTFQPSIRGITSTGTSAGDEANVALYVDGVYYAAQGATAFNLGNIDRVEVLKGPQGTLFGRNATGGAIRVVTSDPSYDPELRINNSVGLSGAQSRELSLYASTGITDRLAINFTGYHYNDDGYLKNADPAFQDRKQGSLHTYTLRSKLLWEATDNFRVVVAADYGKSTSGVELTTTFIDNINGFKNVVGVIPALGDLEVSTNEQNFLRGKNYGGYVNAEYKADKFTLTSITAARVSRIGASLDNDRTNLPINRSIYQVDTDTFSQELNFASDFGGPFDMVAGLFYMHEKAGNPFFNTFAAPLVAVGDGTRRLNGPLAQTSSIRDYVYDDSYSAFGEGTFHLTDTLSIVGGLRYNFEKKRAVTSNLRVPGSAVVETEGDWSNLSYRATINYKPAPDTLVYFTHSTGFKSGVINAAAYTYPKPHDQVRPEKVKAFELGLKTKLGPINIATSAFYYDHKDIQLTTNNALSAEAGVVGINILQNAARAKIAGVDLDVNGKITSRLRLNAGVSWLPKAEYSDFPNGIHYEPAAGGLGAVAIASDLSDTRILRSPKATENIGLTYTMDVAGGDLALSGNYYHTSSLYLVVGEGSKQPGYDLVNFDASWTDPSGHYTIGLWGRNMTNEAYFISGLANSGGFSAVWAKPREMGLRFNLNF